MKVAFDFNPVLSSRFSGFNSFGTGLLKGFEALEEKPEFLLFHSARFSKEAAQATKGISKWAALHHTHIKIRWLERFWRHANFPKLESLIGPFDIYHGFHHLMPPTRNKPRILTVHDLRRYKLPHLYEKSKLQPFERAVKLADHFIAVSASTKRDLCEFFNIMPEKVDVVHLAADNRFHPFSADEKDAAIRRLNSAIGQTLTNYIVAFSSPDKRKNIFRITRAFLYAKAQLPSQVKLLIIGALPKDDDAFCNLLNADGGRNIIILHTVADIRDLLGCADALVFASLYEGFGIPILEAFASGIPVVTSNCSSMPEIAGDAAILVDPLDTESISENIIRLYSDHPLRDNLISYGKERCKIFKWQITAAKTLVIYQNLVGKCRQNTNNTSSMPVF
jgi:glycosyltransferase involved in cell wall biosynthesis